MNTDFKAVISAISDDGQKARLSMADIAGKSLLQYVFEATVKAGAEQVIVATDSPRLGMMAEDFGATVCMIVEDTHQGLGLLAEVANKMAWGDQDIVLDVPVEVPLMPSEVISQVAANLAENSDADGAILFTQVDEASASQDGSINMVIDNSDYVMYLSHHPIPVVYRQQIDIRYKRHAGLSAYSVGLLRAIDSMSSHDIDVAEGIEELKLLYRGMKIHAVAACKPVGLHVRDDESLDVLRKQFTATA